MTLDLAFALADLPNIEPTCLTIDDLCLESQIQFLEAFKSFKDCEKGKTRGKGFANASILNPSRNPNVFTTAERESAKIFDSFSLRYVHEFRFSGKDAKNRLHYYKLDFFFPDCRINVEISPSFHQLYKLVAKRDALKERILKKAGIRTYHVKVYVKKQKGRTISVPDVNRLRKLAKMIKESQKSPETLEYWV